MTTSTLPTEPLKLLKKSPGPMPMRSVKAYLPAFLFLVGCGFIWNMRSQAAMPLAAPLSGILADVPGYSVTEQRLSDDERRVAGMSTYIARSYARDSVPAFTTFVSYYERQTQGKTIHSPRNCLPGAGWEVLTAGTAVLDVGGAKYVVNRYSLKNGPATAIAYYWYQGRGRVVANEYTVKWNLLRDAALAGHTEESLVRVVAWVNPLGKQLSAAEQAKETMAADALGSEIAKKLIVEVARSLPGGLAPQNLAAR